MRKEKRYAVAQLVEARCYKLEGLGFDSRWRILLAALWPRIRISLSQEFRKPHSPGAFIASADLCKVCLSKGNS